MSFPVLQKFNQKEKYNIKESKTQDSSTSCEASCRITLTVTPSPWACLEFAVTKVQIQSIFING